MNFSLWALMAAIASGQGFFLATVLFTKRENRNPNRIIAFLLLILSITLLEKALWWTGLIETLPAFKGIGFGFPLLFGPLMFLYYRTTFERKPLALKDARHFIPFCIAVYFLLPFYLRFFEPLSAALEKVTPSLMNYPWFPVVIFVQMIGYGIWIGWRFKKYFLQNEELRRWHRWLLAAYWGIVAAYIFYRLLSVLDLTAQEWHYLIAFSLTIFIYLAAWLGYIEPRLYNGIPLKEAANPIKYKKSSLNNEQSAILYKSILEKMENEMLYRNSQLTLEVLSKKMDTPRHHISQAINEQSGKRFPEFVNSFRINEAQQLLETTSKKEMNIIEVAYEVGFNTKKSFNLAFKKQTGLTPTAFRNGHKL